MLTMPGRTDFRNNNLWRTIGSPADVTASDSVLDHEGVMPPPGGTVFRVIDIPPESSDEAERARATVATFKQLFPDAVHKPDQRHPGMHLTPTVDYALIVPAFILAGIGFKPVGDRVQLVGLGLAAAFFPLMWDALAAT
jgi:hypothetical protein